ncbi:MAG TPA: nuclear transport factor 2 family protein [Xanthomonadales bacterium]|nr:nuclear transport factor 2 family protein [Xanthomonadales bacterium]
MKILLVCASIMFAGVAVAADAPARKPGDNINLRAGPEGSQALTDAIAKADEDLFHHFFDTCDEAKVAALVADDLEFFHDKDGLSTTSGAAFMDGMKQKCARQREGTDFLSKRVLDRDSLRVYPLNNYGAVETGTHRFYAIVKGEPNRLTETAQFLMIWKQVDGKWKLARVVSYDHRLAPQPPSK